MSEEMIVATVLALGAVVMVGAALLGYEIRKQRRRTKYVIAR